MIGNSHIFITTFSWLKQKCKLLEAYLNEHAIDPENKMRIFFYGGISVTVNLILDSIALLSSYSSTEKILANLQQAEEKKIRVSCGYWTGH